ncbi:MAG TPA: haloacid dehalogenase [Chloroflexaceae bacterium]|nr:haloacid dehalogenase [Chloroflexaceae bacterium]
MTIDSLVAACVAQIEASHGAREQAIVASRALIRQCANSIRAAHRAEFAEAARLLGEAGQTVAQLNGATAERPDIRFAGYTQDALKEYVEAHLVLAFLGGREPPPAAELGVQAAAYLNGLAEAASELRRAILDGLRRGEVARGEALLQVMDDVYSALVTVDYPDAVTGGLRRTTDALRAVLERTRGDMTAALRQDQLTAAMRELEARLGGQ